MNDFDEFDVLNSVMADHVTVSKFQPLFRTVLQKNRVFDTFLSNLVDEEQQPHNCNCCREFLNTYGDLVYIDPQGKLVSFLWSFDINLIPVMYRESVQEMRNLVESSTISSVFYTDDHKWGVLTQGGFNHFFTRAAGHAHKPSTMPHLTVGQAMAAVEEDHELLKRSLNEFSHQSLIDTMSLLKQGQFNRGDKFIPILSWFIDTQAISRQKSRMKHNKIRLAATTAPTGFCRFKNSAVGELVSMVEEKLPLAEIKRRFNNIMDPLQYLRPTAPVKAGNVAAAESLVQKLGIERSLQRRFACLSDMQLRWEPSSSRAATAEGVFGHLLSSDHVQAKSGTGVKITFSKFMSTVAPTAKKMELYLPHKHLPFVSFVSAVDHDAPPILQWDSEDRRNPVSWYHYSGGSIPSQFNLKSNTWNTVIGVAEYPDQWFGRKVSDPRAAFLLAGAKDTINSSSALFPEMLKPALHSCRSTIEHHSNKTKLQPAPTTPIAGISIISDAVLKVTFNDGSVVQYIIDRWD